jgi:hypothetical protein
MVNPDDRSGSKKENLQYLTKKCSHCYEYLALQAQVCTACQKKVGDVDKLGFAEKPVEWVHYLIALIAIVVFVVFAWWGFILE